MIEHPTDAELTVAIINSDLHAFRVLHKRYFEALFRFVCRRTSEETARDLIQDLFLRVWEMREKLDPHKPIKPFLYRLATNISIDHFRKSRKEQNRVPLSFDNDIPIVAEDNDLILTIRTAIEELPEPLRLTFELNRFEGIKYREIAEMLDVSVKTVESRMAKALKILNEKLKHILFSVLCI
jgi:RNA polymerase sigma-70 factor (ECF subfamily)